MSTSYLEVYLVSIAFINSKYRSIFKIYNTMLPFALGDDLVIYVSIHIDLSTYIYIHRYIYTYIHRYIYTHICTHTRVPLICKIYTVAYLLLV